MSGEQKLSPLSCPQCGAAVPIGDGAVARCAFCSIDVPVPPQYIALRDDAKTRVGDRAQLDRLYADASRPPGAFIRGFAAIGQGLSIGGLAAGALIIVGTIIGVIIREHDFGTTVITAVLMVILAIPAFIETTFHFITSRSFDLFDAFGPFGGVLSGLAVWLLVATPLLISRTCRGALATIIRLRMRLAAGRPVQPGGPAICRGCGAALDVPAGALGVRCAYCDADNLVAIPGAVAAKDHRDTTHVHEAIEKVLGDHAVQLGTHRRQLRASLVAWLIGLVCLFEVLYFPSHYFLSGSFTIARTASGHQGELYPDDPGNVVIPKDTVQAVELTFTWRCDTRRDRRCIHFYVALKRGERVTFDTPDKTLDIALQRHQHLVLAVGAWEPWVTDTKLADRTPYTGWYRVEITAPLATESSKTTLRWSTAPE